MTKKIVMLVLFLSVFCGAFADPAPKTLFDFESGDLQGWRIVEGKFGKTVTDRAIFHNTADPYNKQGKYFLSTLEQPDDQPADRYSGIIESPRFTIEGDFLSFLHGGGAHADTYISLCNDDGKEVLRVSGRNEETMVLTEWDVRPFKGKRMFLRVVDKNEGAWGHVTLDDVRIESAEGRQQRLAKAAAQKRRPFDERWKRTQERFDRPDLLARGIQRVYRGEYLEGIAFPVGGIGAGTIQMNGKAEAAGWQIFNNFQAVALPDSFFAVRIAPAGGPAVVRALRTSPVGPFAPMQALSFRGEYPFAWYDFEDPEVSVKVRMEVFSPMIPLDERNSAIPCAIFVLEAENPTDRGVRVAFMASQQNAVGYTGGDVRDRSGKGYGANRTLIVRKDGLTALQMTADRDPNQPGVGSICLATPAAGVTATASWEDPATLLKDFAENGALNGPDSAGPSPNERTLNGALSVTAELPPRGKVSVPFVLAWYFPNARHGGGAPWEPTGNMYANWWPDAAAVARYVASNLKDLSDRTRLYHDTFYASNLPHWLLDRISSQMAILRTKTCFWVRDGYFGAWEGCSPEGGCCGGNCTHVWHYAQGHARLFPAIARRMREQVYATQGADGALPYRQLTGHGPAADGLLGDILGTYREHLCSADGAWLKSVWPKTKKAMDYAVKRWDPDEDGVLSGPQANTLDGELGGSTSWIGTLYLAALQASERMAELQGDTDAAKRYARIRASGAEKQNATLWNGEYYVQIRDPQPRQDYGDGCSIDQVLGEWWAGQVGLTPAYPQDRVRSALGALLRYNFRPDFRGVPQRPRKFVPDDQAGMQMIQWPEEVRPQPCILYADEVMTGFEYTAAATMVQRGMLREGYMVAKAVADRYDGRRRTGLTGDASASWGYSGNPFGDDECGKYYGRALSVWSLLLASQGFLYDGPAGRIGFDPVWKPENHVSMFTAAEGWGLYTQLRKDNQQTGRIEIRQGRLRIASLVFRLPEQTRAKSAEVRLGGKKIGAALAAAGNEVRLTLEKPEMVEAGNTLEVTLTK